MTRITETTTTATPWGKADMVTRYTLGINFYNTPGHGGFHVSKKLNKRIPEYFRTATFGQLGNRGWYEEDSDWAIVVTVFATFRDGSIFTEAEIKQARESLQSYLPNELARWDGAHTVAPAAYDVTGNIIAYESGELDQDEQVILFQHLIDSGLYPTLQGHYGRTAAALIAAGVCTKGGR